MNSGTATFIILCGAPGTGKTTVAREVVKRLPEGACFTSDDLKRDRYRRLPRLAREAAAWHPVVILDATFYSRAHRDRVRALGYPVLVVHLVCPIRDCIRRNAAREQPIPEKAVRMLLERMEPPGPDENPLRINTARVRPGVAARRIVQALRRMARGLEPVPGRQGSSRAKPAARHTQSEPA